MISSLLIFPLWLVVVWMIKMYNSSIHMGLKFFGNRALSLPGFPACNFFWLERSSHFFLSSYAFIQPCNLQPQISWKPLFLSYPGEGIPLWPHRALLALLNHVSPTVCLTVSTGTHVSQALQMRNHGWEEHLRIKSLASLGSGQISKT